MRSVVLALLLLLGFIAPSALAWNNGGHRVTSVIAFDNLTPEAKAAVVKLLRAHKRFDADLLKDAPDDLTDEQKIEFAFCSAGVWPDMLRSPTHPMGRTHHKPVWHYINQPFYPDNDKDALPPFPVPEPLDGARNILEAIDLNVAKLKDPALADEEKATALCWVIHLVEDLHQPMHAVASVSKRFPEGDRGGNSILVTRNGVNKNLHAYWDEILGNYLLPNLVRQVAKTIVEDPARTKAALADPAKVLDPRKWAEESLKLAVDVAYDNGKLARNPNVDNPDAQAVVRPALSDEYEARAKDVARTQAALAGYRLAALLNETLKPAQ
jgi:hypothetical protein